MHVHQVMIDRVYSASSRSESGTPIPRAPARRSGGNFFPPGIHRSDSHQSDQSRREQDHRESLVCQTSPKTASHPRPSPGHDPVAEEEPHSPPGPRPTKQQKRVRKTSQSKEQAGGSTVIVRAVLLFATEIPIDTQMLNITTVRFVLIWLLSTVYAGARPKGVLEHI